MKKNTPLPKPFVDLSDEQVHWDLSESLSYSQYLNLDKLLDAAAMTEPGASGPGGG